MSFGVWQKCLGPISISAKPKVWREVLHEVTVERPAPRPRFAADKEARSGFIAFLPKHPP